VELFLTLYIFAPKIIRLIPNLSEDQDSPIQRYCFAKIWFSLWKHRVGCVLARTHNVFPAKLRSCKHAPYCSPIFCNRNLKLCHVSHYLENRAMAYHLLTGATGLIGRYLIRRLTAAGVPLAVLVRPGKFQTSSDRLEAVMRHWDVLEGRAIPIKPA
jgi:hypothetical protein